VLTGQGVEDSNRSTRMAGSHIWGSILLAHLLAYLWLHSLAAFADDDSDVIIGRNKRKSVENCCCCSIQYEP